MLAAGHAAVHHRGHVMAAVHVMRIARGSLVVMMLFDGTHSGSAARGVMGHPGGDGVWCVEKKNGEQADACGHQAPAIVACRSHHFPNRALPQPVAQTENRFRDYIVTRHSLQGGFGRAVRP